MGRLRRAGWLVALAAVPCFAAEPKLAVVKKTEVFQGGIVEIEAAADGLTAIEGRFGKEKIGLYPTGAGKFGAVLGIDLEAEPGPARIWLKAVGRSGSEREATLSFKVKARAFATESFSVAQDHEPVGPEAMERIRAEQEQFARVFAASIPHRLWEGTFIRPVAGEVRSPFGLRRIVNGIARAPHAGADLRAPQGTQVLASNHGRVVLVGDFFFSGKSMVLDHGAGVFTMYFHLSEFLAQQGAAVRKGDPIALSGMTGRVTGPHLHWGARIYNARIDPFELIEKIGAERGEAASANRE
ncbi:MAG TPA: M23 family metallopeptidase [candidate division Zixibacteria bacterium]|nr:M23 family metallopeptidase [candidate division Zixibacteria bacterium]